MLAALAGWASAPVKLYPGVARLAGQNDTAWRSSAVLHNPTASTQTALLELLPRGGSAVAASATVHLAAGETREIANLYDFLQAGDGAGMLRVTGSVIAWVRAYNEGNGTFGQDLPAASPGAGFAPNSPIMFPFSTPTDIKRDFRSNLMLVNLGASDVTVTIINGASVATQVVPAGAYVQINNLGAFLGASPGFGAAQVSADGEWFGAIATIDPFTGDPTTVRGLASSDPGERYFPSIAQIAGKNGAAWRSEAVFYNPADAPISAQLDLIPRGESQIAVSTSLTLGPGETRRIGNLYDFLGAPAGAGTLRVTGAALAWVRTYNQRPRPGDTAVETFGQDLPPVASEGGIPARAFVALPFNNPADTLTGFRSNLVLLNLEDHDITVSLRAGGITKTQAVPAGAYVQIDGLGAFLGTLVGESCVWGIADGRWATAIATIDPFTNDPTTFRAVEEWQPPSSSDLIDQAVADHLISDEQALTYKVFAAVGDPRLPAQYRGDDRGEIEPNSLTTAALQFSTLSPATQDLIGPYLVPPFVVGSSWDLRHGGGRAGASSFPAIVCRPWQTLCGILHSWEYVTGAHVRVWYLSANRATDLPIANDFVSQAEFHIWGQLLSVMGTQALLTDLGDGAHLDIELVDEEDLRKNILGRSVPYPKSQCPNRATHIAILRTIADQKERRATLAHEMMHSFQFALDTNFCTGDYRWLMEATATWFEDYSYPDGDSEHEYAPTYFLSTKLSLDDKSIETREYSAYLFFFYLTRIRALPATVIGDIWRFTQTSDALHALDAGIRKNGTTLDIVWPDFAVYCWNDTAPFNTFQTKDLLLSRASMQASLGVAANPPGLVAVQGRGDLVLPHLSMRYYQLDPSSNGVSSLTFFNGLTRSLDEVDVPLYGTVLNASDLPTAQKGAHVDALIKKGGVWTHEDWTEKPYKDYCLDRVSERVERLILILSNADISLSASVIVPGTYSPGVMGNNIGCAKWEGSADLRYKLGDEGASEHFVASGVRLESADPTIATGFLVTRPFNVTAGTLSWSVTGTYSNCTVTGSVPGVSAVDPGNYFNTLDWVVSGVGYRGMTSAIFFPWLQPLGKIKFQCPNSRTHADEDWHGAAVSLAVLPDSWARVSADGKTIQLDMSKAPGYDRVTGTWTLHAKREP
jgi:hypothetical protein